MGCAHYLAESGLSCPCCCLKDSQTHDRMKPLQFGRQMFYWKYWESRWTGQDSESGPHLLCKGEFLTRHVAVSHSCHSETLVRALHSARAARMSVVIWGTQVLHKLEIFGSFEISADADFCCLDIPFLSSRQRSHSENGCQAPVDKKGCCPVLPVQSCYSAWQLAKGKS